MYSKVIYLFFFKFFYLKRNDTNELTYKNRKKLTDLENELMVAGGEGIVREFGKVMYTLLYSKWTTSKDLLL